MEASVDVENKNIGQYQVKFFTKLEKYYVPDTPFSIPSNATNTQLNSIITKLLFDESNDTENISFDFLIESKLLRSQLSEHIIQNNLSEENVLEIEYIIKYDAPQPQNSLNHDDWVSAVDANEKWIVTGCYDNTIHIWSFNGDKKLTIPGHTGPIKGVSWLKCDEKNMRSFVSVSQDQTAIIWKWNEKKKYVECVNVCKGHARSVDCITTQPNGSRFVTGSWDKMLKIWSVEDTESTNEIEENAKKKQKTSSGVSKTKTPIMTLCGHHEPVSSLQWTDSNEICSASWDHTIRLWDVELGGIKSQLPGSKAFFHISYSSLSRLLLSSSADRHIRLWDPRTKGGSIMKCNFSSHTGWVSSTDWSPTNEHLFMSGSHDQIVKVWDTRLSNAPLYDMSGHEDKVLCVNWSNANYLLSGAADNTLKVFEAEKSIT